MTWNYRVMRHRDGSLAMHEVYYHQDGTVRAWTAEPVTFVADADEGLPGIVDALAMALKDAGERPILDVDDQVPVVAKIDANGAAAIGPIGSSFESFLDEEGIREEVSEQAAERVRHWQKRT